MMMGMATLSPASTEVRTLEGPPIMGGVPTVPPPGPESGLLSRCVSQLQVSDYTAGEKRPHTLGSIPKQLGGFLASARG